MKGFSHDYSHHDQSKAVEMAVLQWKYPSALLFIAIALLQQQATTSHINQRSRTFLAPRTGFVEDNFSMGGGGSSERDGSGGNGSDGEPWGEADEARSLAHRSPPAVRPGS